MEFKRRGSIRFTLAAFIAGTALLIVMVFSMVFGSYLVDAVHERGKAEMTLRLQEGASAMRLWLAAKSDSVLSYTDIFKYEDTDAMVDVFLAGAVARSIRDPEMYDLYFGTAAGPFAGGYFKDGSGWIPDPTWDWTGRPWYLAALRSSGAAYSDPYVDANTGELVFTISAAARASGRLIGVVGADVFMTTMNKIADALKPTPSAKVHFINADGLFVTTDDLDKIMKVDFFESLSFSGQREAVVSSEMNLLFPEKTGQYLASAVIPELGWRLMAYGDANDILGPVARVRLIIVAVSVSSMVLAVLMALLLLARPVKHIRDVASGISAIAAGGADLTSSLKIASKDEIGELAWRFNEFIAYLDGLLGRISKASAQLTEISKVARQDSGMVQNGISSVVGALASAIDLSRQESEELRVAAATAHKFFGRYRGLQSNLLSQAASVEETAAAMTEISKTMDGVAVLGKRGQELANELDERVKKSAAAVAELINIIADIDKRSETVSAFADVIREVAERTNLLAMNAAIEAAHAGSSGKGFAVVADEIRKLAESSSGETEAIAKTVTEIRTTIARGAMLSKSAETDIASMVEALLQSRNVSLEISGATAEEARAGEEVLLALRQINDVNIQVKTQLDEQSADLETVENALKAAIDGGERLVEVVEAQGSEIESINTTMDTFAARMKKVADEAENLACLMASFTLRDGSCD